MVPYIARCASVFFHDRLHIKNDKSSKRYNNNLYTNPANMN